MWGKGPEQKTTIILGETPYLLEFGVGTRLLPHWLPMGPSAPSVLAEPGGSEAPGSPDPTLLGICRQWAGLSPTFPGRPKILAGP